MSRPGRALGRLHRPVLTVVIPLDGDVPDTGSGLEGVADAVSLTASAPREAGVAALAPTSDGVEPTIRSVLGQSLGDLEVLAVAGAPGAGGRVSPRRVRSTAPGRAGPPCTSHARGGDRRCHAQRASVRAHRPEPSRDRR